MLILLFRKGMQPVKHHRFTCGIDDGGSGACSFHHFTLIHFVELALLWSFSNFGLKLSVI